MKEFSWKYEQIVRDTFGDKYIEIFEYSGKICVCIGSELYQSNFDIIATNEEQKAWEIYNSLYDTFSLHLNDEHRGLTTSFKE